MLFDQQVRILAIPSLLLLVNMFLSSAANAQDTSAAVIDTPSVAVTDTPITSCVQKDIADIIRVALNKPPKVDTSGKSGSFILMPIIGSNPATGFMVGVGGQYGFKMTGEETNYSLISGSFQLTTKGQKLFLLKNTVYTKDNKIIFTGDWRYLIFSQATYGLGTNAPTGGIIDYQFNLGGQETSDDSLAQQMKFNFLRFYQSVSFRIKKGLYVGCGYYLDAYSKIVDEKLRLNPGDSLITSHYAYNKTYGFDTSKYNVSTLNANFVLDTRDNIINSYKGHYLFLNLRTSLKLLGANNAASFINAEWRSFLPFSKKNPRHQIAFWAMGDFTPHGKFPYMILPATAYDQRGRSGRGYTQGRFRGNTMVYGETEYRFPISKCGGVLGGVVFLNGTTASNPDQDLKLFKSIQPGYGAGLRVMVDKKTRTNLCIDYGFGNNSSGFYLAVSETF